MTTATRQRAPRFLPLATLAVAALATPRPGRALVLDDRGEMRLGMRAYTAARIGTEKMGGEDDPLVFPDSATGHLRQHRYFLELKLDHDIQRIATTTKGLAWLLGWFDPGTLRYSLQYRGEGEGIYDYGPDEFHHQFRKMKAVRLEAPDSPVLRALGLIPAVFDTHAPDEYVRRRIDRLRRIARQRHRFFRGYLDVEKGPVFVRVGRQVLAWGETDVFRLLDNINPLDDSFGGFLIPLDERLLPLEMVRGSYQFGSLGPLSDSFLEGFAAVGNRVSTFPGIPEGSPWEPGGLSRIVPQLRTVRVLPAREDLRGGGRFVFTFRDVTYTLAHYYTYLDVPGVRFLLPGQRDPDGPGPLTPTNTPRFRNEILGIQRFPRVPITGASLTFPLPSLYAVVRSEAAYFQDEPMNRQGRGNSADALCALDPARNTFCPQGPAGARRLIRENNIEGGLDPFVYPRFAVPAPIPGLHPVGREHGIHGKLLQRDTFNLALGLDVNRFVRWINPRQTLFFTTQFFYKHVFDSPGDLVLPVPFRTIPVADSYPIVGTKGFLGTGCRNRDRPGTHSCELRPRLFHLDDDRFLHTFRVDTSYSGGRIAPSYGMFYDWQGVLVFQPGVAYVRDPFRAIFDYTRLEGAPSGALGTLRDRDNVRFQVEYVF